MSHVAMEALSRMISGLAIHPDVICSYRVENLHAWIICFLLHVLLQSLTPHLLGKDRGSGGKEKNGSLILQDLENNSENYFLNK